MESAAQQQPLEAIDSNIAGGVSSSSSTSRRAHGVSGAPSPPPSPPAEAGAPVPSKRLRKAVTQRLGSAARGRRRGRLQALKDTAAKDIALVEENRAALSKNLKLMENMEFLWLDYHVRTVIDSNQACLELDWPIPAQFHVSSSSDRDSLRWPIRGGSRYSY